MSRRSGQNPKLEIRNGKYTFRYWKDLPGVEERQRVRIVICRVGQMTESEAKRRVKEFMATEGINSNAARIPSVQTFALAAKYYREVFAPEWLRESTVCVAETHLAVHLEPDWKDVPVEHITIDAVNEWARKKRKEGLSWTTIKNILRTMQRVLSCVSKDKTPPFSQNGLRIPEKDKLQMRIRSRKAMSFSWDDSKRVVRAVLKLDSLDDTRKQTYATAFLLAAATGLRCGELFALKVDDVDFRGNTIRVDESVDRMHTVGPCKNAAAYRTVVLNDREGKVAMKVLKRFLSGIHSTSAFVFHSRRGKPLRETNVLTDGLHPALRHAGLQKAGMHGFRHGCNRRWELAGMNPAVLRQQMGHSSSAMTARYTGEIPVESVRAEQRRIAAARLVGTNGTRVLFEAVA